jgi:hypothetical protein
MLEGQREEGNQEGRSSMRHFHVVSAKQPAKGQIDTILQIISAVSAVVGLVTQISAFITGKIA